MILKRIENKINSLIDAKIAINTSSLFIIYFLNFLISLLTLPHLFKNYGYEKWGEIVFCQIILNYLIWIIDWSFNQYSSKFISINNNNLEEQKKIFRETWTAQLILTFLSLIFIIIISLFTDKYKLIFKIFSLSLIGNFLQPFWFLNGLEKIYESAILQLINKIIFAVLIINFITPNSNKEIYFIIFGISSLISGFLYQLRLYQNHFEIIGFTSLKKGLRTIKKSSSLYSSMVISSLVNTSLPLIINYYLGSTNLGIYNVADRIKGICSQLINPISHSIFPRISNKYNKDKILGNIFLKKIIICTLLIILFFYFIINFNIEFIVSYFAKSNNEEIIKILRVLLISFLVNVINEILISQYMIPNGRYRIINKVRISILLLTIILGLLLTYHFGIFGTATANLISEIGGFLFLIYQFKKTINIRYQHQIF